MSSNQQQGDNLQLLSRLNQTQVNTAADIKTSLVRNTGILKKVYMRWQTNIQTLNQFKQIYTDRLNTLRSAFYRETSNTIEDLGNDEKICELVGLFKRIEKQRIRAFELRFEQKYKYNKSLYSQQDTYELQDQTSRVKLEFHKHVKLNGSKKQFIPIETPYGVVVKCYGQYSAKLNRFLVTNVQTPKPALQRKMILPSTTTNNNGNERNKFMFVLCEPTISDLVKTLNYLQFSPKPQNLDTCELVVIGGLDYTNIYQVNQYDELMSQLGAVINTYIVPSSCDQTSHIYPLAPIPKTLLNKSYKYKNCANCSNPQLLESKFEDICLDILISCGENLLNLKANCNIHNDIELMKFIIEYRHCCPSSAFSLPILSYKFDPLVLLSTPHLMIHGKCDSFQTLFYTREFDNNESVNVRLVGLAKGDFVRINLTSPDLETINWQIVNNSEMMGMQ